MRDLSGKTAVITGAGSGIGRGTALALAEAGMNIVVADIDEASAANVVEEVRKLGGPSAIAVRTDVSDRSSVEQLAEAAWAAFGEVHVLHNNAGVALFLRLENMTEADWQFIFSVNVFGVVNGIQAFLPRLKAQAGEKHIVNTASMAGIVSSPALGAYNATKYAVVAISETLRQEVEADGIGVSVLCPGVIATNLVNTTLQRRPEGGNDFDIAFDASSPEAANLLNIMAPEDAGQIVRRAIENNDLYILTHPEFEVMARRRFDAILDAFANAKDRTVTA